MKLSTTVLFLLLLASCSKPTVTTDVVIEKDHLGNFKKSEHKIEWPWEKKHE